MYLFDAFVCPCPCFGTLRCPGVWHIICSPFDSLDWRWQSEKKKEKGKSYLLMRKEMFYGVRRKKLYLPKVSLTCNIYDTNRNISFSWFGQLDEKEIKREVREKITKRRKEMILGFSWRQKRKQVCCVRVIWQTCRPRIDSDNVPSPCFPVYLSSILRLSLHSSWYIYILWQLREITLSYFVSLKHWYILFSASFYNWPHLYISLYECIFLSCFFLTTSSLHSTCLWLFLFWLRNRILEGQGNGMH